ncbi:MAG: CHAD domain-containing protein [Pirellulaceae bacterium]|nr:CHAD domain-containing protein [Pirellulaceae bacterium]
MARSTKWIKNVSPDQPAADVARLALCARLDAVVYFLPKAAMEADEDIEYVHQLRVATRRSMAAILTFQSLLPVRRTRKLRKMLRRLRKAAGEARDLDVLYERLDKQARRTHIPGMKKVLTKVSRRRDAAQRPLLKIYQKWQSAKYERKIKKLLERVRWRSDSPEPSFQHVATQAMQSTTNEFLHAASADLTDIAALHQMRIIAKQVRYTVELTANAFAPVFRDEIYPLFTDIQNRLGAINDFATAEQLFGTWSTEAKTQEATDELARMADDECNQLNASAEEFRLWWTQERADSIRQCLSPYVMPAPTEPPIIRPDA